MGCGACWSRAEWGRASVLGREDCARRDRKQDAAAPADETAEFHAREPRSVHLASVLGESSPRAEMIIGGLAAPAPDMANRVDGTRRCSALAPHSLSAASHAHGTRTPTSSKRSGLLCAPRATVDAIHGPRGQLPATVARADTESARTPGPITKTCPVPGSFPHGRYWTRTSDPLLVRPRTVGGGQRPSDRLTTMRTYVRAFLNVHGH